MKVTVRFGGTRCVRLGCVWPIALVRLLDDLYDLVLSDAGALDYRHGPLDLGEIVAAAVGDRRAAFADKGVELQLENDDAMPMKGDRRNPTISCSSRRDSRSEWIRVPKTMPEHE